MSRRRSRRRWAIARCTASRASRCSWRAWRKTSRSFATKPRRSRRSRRSRSWSPGVSRRAAVEATCRSRLLSATSGRCATGRPSESRPACEPEPARSGCKTGAQLIPPDGVERLDHAGSRQMRLKQLAGGDAVAVELVERAVSLRVVVGDVDDDLAVEALRGQLAVASERHRDDDDVAELGRFWHRPRTRPRAELLYQRAERVGRVRIADRDVVAGANEDPRKRAADMAGADDPDPHRTRPGNRARRN